MATDKQFFKNLMEEQQVSLRQVAAKMGLGHSQLSLTFSDKRRMQLDEAAQLAKIFGMPLARVAEAAGISLSKSSTIPLLGIMAGDGTVELLQKPERTPAPDGLPEGIIAIQARSADSSNAWLDGWNFFCQEPKDVARGIEGRFCYVQITDGPRALATVRRGYNLGTYNLSGPYSAESVSLDWAALVLKARP